MSVHPNMPMPSMPLPSVITPVIRTTPDGKKANTGVNCWVAASASLLANDPFIAQFVLEVYNSTSHSLNAAARAYASARSDFITCDEELDCAMSLLRCISAINQCSDDDTIKAASVGLYADTLAWRNQRAIDDPSIDVADLQSNAFRHAYDPYMRILLKGMQMWWGEYESSMYGAYGYRIGFDTVLMRQSDKRLFKIDDFSHQINSVAVEACHISGKYLDLNYFINHTYFGLHTMQKDQYALRMRVDGVTEASQSIHPEQKAAMMHREITSLPWKFCVHIDRYAPDPTVAVPVCYNPRSLVIGPTTESDEWANYRLVGRIEHNSTSGWRGGHYRSNIMNASTRMEPYDETKIDDPIILDGYNWQTPFAAKFPLTGGVYHDTEAVLLEFERHDPVPTYDDGADIASA